MRVTVIANPKSGRGRASVLAGRLASALQDRGHAVELPGLDAAHDLLASPAGTDRIVIVGGDGTVHHACAAAARAQVPVYHLATGTENLFARWFGMSRDPGVVLRHLEADTEPRAIDLGSANGVPFALMCSLGVDASVIHRVERSRTRGGHLAYVRPSIVEAFAPRPARVTVRADDGEPRPFVGTVVVANLPAYALRVDPCPDAIADDAMLDIAYLPATTSVGTAWDLLRCKLRSRRIERARAGRITITGVGPASFIQIDGERPAPGRPCPVLAEGDTLTLTTWPDRLVVHAPA